MYFKGGNGELCSVVVWNLVVSCIEGKLKTFLRVSSCWSSHRSGTRRYSVDQGLFCTYATSVLIAASQIAPPTPKLGS